MQLWEILVKILNINVFNWLHVKSTDIFSPKKTYLVRFFKIWFFNSVKYLYKNEINGEKNMPNSNLSLGIHMSINIATKLTSKKYQFSS